MTRDKPSELEAIGPFIALSPIPATAIGFVFSTNESIGYSIFYSAVIASVYTLIALVGPLCAYQDEKEAYENERKRRKISVLEGKIK